LCSTSGSMRLRLAALLHAATRAWSLATATYEVKRSRFVAWGGRATSWAEAKALLDAQSDSKARHNCYAWVGATSARSSDDGEPSGTAGKPIREAIAAQGLEDVVVLVTRYKPSTAPKLGAGGLIRAYAAAARAVLDEMSPSQWEEEDGAVVVRLDVALEQLGAAHGLLSKFGATRLREDYDVVGRATLDVCLPDETRLSDFRNRAAALGGNLTTETPR